MKHTTRFLLLCTSLCGAALFAWPTVGSAFSLIGGSLGISTSGNGYQRDFRVFDNSTDAAAHDNGIADAGHPGALGGILAAWKGAEQWNSDQGGQRNFDFDFQGAATGVSGGNDNVISWGDPSGCGGGVIAFMDPGFSPGISNGWQIRMCESGISWNDGPGTSFGGTDIQGIVTHEIGHALGLGHTSSGCGGSCSNDSTMCPFACGNSTNARNIETDDRNGLNAIYGAIPSNKPVITSLTGSFVVGQTLVIHGSDFPGTVNVKFTAQTTQNTGSISGVVANVSASPTQVSVTIPAAAKDGNVLVWAPSIGRLSNPFPIDVGALPPGPPTISGVSPDEAEALFPTLVTLTGTMFTGATQVTFGGQPVAGFTVLDAGTITFTTPPATAIGPANITVTTGIGTSNAIQFDYVETDPLELLAPGFLVTGTPATWNWGGKPNQAVFMLFNASGATIPMKGTQLLVWDVLLPFPNTNAAGLGALPVPSLTGVPPGTTLRAQILTTDPGNPGFSTLELSNITQSLVLF